MDIAGGLSYYVLVEYEKELMVYVATSFSSAFRRCYACEEITSYEAIQYRVIVK